MIEKVMKTIEDKDFMGLSQLFSDKCNYFDYMPAYIGERDYHVYGRTGIEMFFHNKFFFNAFRITNSEIENETTANCLAIYNGTAVHAKFQIEAMDDNGKIRELVVIPASGFAGFEKMIDTNK